MKREKSYIECLSELTPDAVYKGLLLKGFFAEKLPPVFTSSQFFKYCKDNKIIRPQDPPKCQYISYENMGHNNVPREFGIPAPFAYERLCFFIKKNWDQLLEHFHSMTSGDSYKISRIHIRKLHNTESIFSMAYKTTFDRAKSPVGKIKIGKRYKVTADISQCFPSIYSHSIPWALVSEAVAKREKNKKTWFNKFDKEISANKYGETDGLLIGPYASNLIAEIVLVCIDKKLGKKYEFIRSIDDYECYVKTREEAESFIVDLACALKEFNLNINRKKTRIIELPTVSDGDWTRKLRNYVAHINMSKWGIGQISAYMDVVNELHLRENDSAVLFYALKQVSKIDLTEDARVFYINQIFQLTVLRPYLFTKIDDFLFNPFNVTIAEIKSISDIMYKDGLKNHNYEAVAFALFYAIKYLFKLDKYDAQSICKTNDVVAIVLGNYYAVAMELPQDVYQERTKKILAAKENDYATLFANWLHCYEFSSKRQLSKVENLRDIKEREVSFLKPLKDFQITWDERWGRHFADWKCYWEGDLCERLIEKAYGSFRKSIQEPRTRTQFHGYFRCVLANFYSGLLLKENIIIPKSSGCYNAGTSLDFSGQQVDFGLIFWILQWLKVNCYIGERCGEKGKGATFYWVKNKLRDEFQENALGLVKHFSKQKGNSLVIVRDGNHQEVIIDIGEVGIRYKDVIMKMNAVNAKHKFTCRLIKNWGAIPFRPQMRAVFNMCSMEFGGRLYPNSDYCGPDYQNIHSEDRTSIEIDGKRTVELDYSGLHINILYAKEGIQCKEDPYERFGMQLRPAAKYASLIMLNAKDKTSVVHIIQEELKELRARAGLSFKKQKLLNSLQSLIDVPAFVDEIETCFSPLKKYFYQDIGRRLQREDSELAIKIIEYFVNKGIPILSVHDSFIVPAQYKQVLKEVMKSVFNERYPGYKICVK